MDVKPEPEVSLCISSTSKLIYRSQDNHVPTATPQLSSPISTLPSIDSSSSSNTASSSSKLLIQPISSAAQFSRSTILRDAFFDSLNLAKLLHMFHLHGIETDCDFLDLVHWSSEDRNPWLYGFLMKSQINSFQFEKLRLGFDRYKSEH